MNRRGCEFTILDGHYRGGRAGSPNAIADGIKARQAGLKTVVNCEEALPCFESKERGKRRFVLSDSFDDLVTSEHKLRAPDGLRRRAAGRIWRT
jgi:hypothetical protein